MKLRSFANLLSGGILLLALSACDGGGTKGSGVIDGDGTNTELGIVAPRATGVVTNPEGIPVPGAVVTNDDTGERAITDASGRYELPINAPGVCASVSFGEQQQAICVLLVDDPNLSPQVVLDFVLDVPTSALPEPPPVDEPPSSGDEVRACGGLLGLRCTDDEYCDFPPDAICGAADATGICKAIPEVCIEIYAPVCGCDGKTYGNSCIAAASGVSAASEGECS